MTLNSSNLSAVEKHKNASPYEKGKHNTPAKHIGTKIKVTKGIAIKLIKLELGTNREKKPATTGINKMLNAICKTTVCLTIRVIFRSKL
ncbi:MAG: hypothetical protein Alis2KO_23630 [Aliiglaciecola sp.]